MPRAEVGPDDKHQGLRMSQGCEFVGAGASGAASSTIVEKHESFQSETYDGEDMRRNVVFQFEHRSGLPA